MAWWRAAAADDPLLVDVPQHALLTKSAADRQRIWLVRLSPAELVYRTADHADDERSLIARPAVKASIKLLSGDVFRIDPRTGRFNRFDELSGRFAPPPTSRQGQPAGGGGEAADRGTTDDEGRDGSAELHTEIAEGTGTDPAAALADALRNAVRQAVGVYVDSETVTDKEDVIADRVLTFSDAFVVRYEEISRTVDAGLVTIKVSAVIEAGKLMTNLREAKVNTIRLDGADLVASALTRKESKDAAADLLRKKLQELPGALVAEALPFKTLDYDARREQLTVTYMLRGDQDKYRAFLDSAQPLLQQVAAAKTSIVLKVEPIWSDGWEPIWQDDGMKRRLVAARGVLNPAFRYGPDLAGHPDTWCLWLMTRWDAAHRNAQWQGYALDVALSQVFRDVRGGMMVRLDLVDAVDEVVKSEVHDPLAGLERPAFWFGWTRPRPRQFLAKSPRTWPPLDSCPTRPILRADFAAADLAVDRGWAVNVYVTPLCYSPADPQPPVLSPGAWQVCQISIPAEQLARVQQIKATAMFVPAGQASSSAAPPPVSVNSSLDTRF